MLRFAFALIALLFCAPCLAGGALETALEQLANPGKDKAPKPLEELLAAYAPRIWFHPDERFGPMDPLEFLRNSSLWLRRNWSPNELVAAKGLVQPSELGTGNSGLYARRARTVWGLDGPAFSPVGFLASANARTPSRQGMRPQDFFLKFEGDASANPPFESVPIFWKLGASPALEKLGHAAASEARVLIEYWYHLPFSHATTFRIGNHEGDWEGLAVLVDLGVDALGTLTHKLRAVYFAQHDAGRWLCPDELEKEATGRPVAYSALGTHATYPKPGAFKHGVVRDVTAQGKAWESWRQIRALALEPYFGFGGSWGDIRFLPYTSGPTAPDAVFKTLPSRKVARDDKALAEVRARCSL